MNERRILDIIEQEIRAHGLPCIEPRSKMAEALRRAALRIARDAEADQRNAARTASQVGFSITRGRTRL